MRWSLSLFAVVLTASLTVGCGSSGDTPAPDAAAPGSGSPAGSPAGGVVVACSYPAKFQCGALTVIGAPAGQVAMSMCMRDNGTPLAVCPTANLIGCCTQSTIKNCYYTGVTTAVMKLESECTAARGTWSTAP